MIRKLEEKDINEVMNIWLETNIKAHNFVPEQYWENNIENVKNEILKAEVYVYEKEKKIVGFVGIVKDYVAGIFVTKDMQNNGIGKQLINKCKEKHNELTLEVYEKNKNAINFYKKEGFYIISQNIDDQTKEIELCMKWNK